MSLQSSGPDDRITQIIQLTERLTDMIAAETRAFEARRPQDVAATVGETSRLANIYRLESARLKQDPSLIEGADLNTRVALIRATEAFDSVLARHGRALEAARAVTEGLVQAIAKEVAANRTQPVGYGSKAQTMPGDASAITLNKRA
jgi:hypothetical protein